MHPAARRCVVVMRAAGRTEKLSARAAEESILSRDYDVSFFRASRAFVFHLPRLKSGQRGIHYSAKLP